LGLVSPLTVALTSTILAFSAAGATTTHVVVEVQSTDVANVPPNLMVVALVPSAKPVPVIVTLVPPVMGPVFGFTFVIVGASNLK